MRNVYPFTNVIGFFNILASIFNISLAIYIIWKNKMSQTSRSYSLFFFIIGISLLFMSFYTSLDLGINELKFLYSFVFIISFFGINFLIVGTRSITLKKNIFHPVYLIMGFLGIILFLMQSSEINHSVEMRRAYFTPLYAILLFIYLTIPSLYSIYLLHTINKNQFSEERLSWLNRLKIAFSINLIYPISNSLAGISEEFEVLGLLEFLFVISSLIIISSLPNYKDWFFDEIKIEIIKNNIIGNLENEIEIVFKKFGLWRDTYDHSKGDLNSSDLKSYLNQINDINLK